MRPSERPQPADLERHRIIRRLERVGVAGATLAAIGLIAVAGGPAPGASAAQTRTLTIMVTNDDGVTAPGIDAVVQGLRTLPHTKVTVVAPLTNQSGTGGKTTAGKLPATKAKTASGYSAVAVAGYPADTVIWAIKDHGLSFRPDLVVSGINFGENIGPLASLSGTVGAAKAAVQLGIPALASSQGVDNGASPDFSQGVTQVLHWVTAHRAALVNHSYNKPIPQGNLNIPTCPNGTVRGPVNAPLASSLDGINIGSVNSASTSTTYSNDAQAFVLGYAVISPL